MVELEAPHQTNTPTEAGCIKCSKAGIHRKTHCIPEIQFEDQRLTSFAGLVLFQALRNRLGLKEQLTACFRHLKVSPVFVHDLSVLLLDRRRLQDMRHYREHPIVRYLPGLDRLPDVATVSRTQAGMDNRSVDKLLRFNR